MKNEQRLWQQVVFLAVKDALEPDEPIRAHGSGKVLRYWPSIDKLNAIWWIHDGGREYETACNLAEIDPEFLREAFIAGRVDTELLSKACGR